MSAGDLEQVVRDAKGVDTRADVVCVVSTSMRYPGGEGVRR